MKDNHSSSLPYKSEAPSNCAPSSCAKRQLRLFRSHEHQQIPGMLAFDASQAFREVDRQAPVSSRIASAAVAVAHPFLLIKLVSISGEERMLEFAQFPDNLISIVSTATFARLSLRRVWSHFMHETFSGEVLPVSSRVLNFTRLLSKWMRRDVGLLLSPSDQPTATRICFDNDRVKLGSLLPHEANDYPVILSTSLSSVKILCQSMTLASVAILQHPQPVRDNELCS